MTTYMHIYVGVQWYSFYFPLHPVALGESMMPTINPNPDGLPDIVWADMRKPHDVKPGDVVTLISPNDPRKRFIKRVIAMPGEWVYCAGEMVSANISSTLMNPTHAFRYVLSFDNILFLSSRS